MNRKGDDRLGRGRDAFRRKAWQQSFEELSRADEAKPLGAEDLWLLALAALMMGKEAQFLDLLERAQRESQEAAEYRMASRCAFRIGFHLASRGETARAAGWFSRAQRLLDHEKGDCVERGYLLLPVVHQHLSAGNYQSAFRTAQAATEIAERFGDRDLHAFALHAQGVALLRQAQIQEGLGLIDEAMVAVAGDELSAPFTGLIYCSVISACRNVYALGRAHEWTEALSSWCEQQPDLVAFAGQCRVHRAELMQLHGDWREALEETNLARLRANEGNDRAAAAAASYQQGEVYRLLGEAADAEAAFREASRSGREPQPGLALLRLLQGNEAASLAAVRRLLGETRDMPTRARLLPACIEIMLAANEVASARMACRELEEIASVYQSSVLGAIAARARGAVLLADGDAEGAIVSLRRAWNSWQELEAPYEGARTRWLLGMACRELGDVDTAELELEAAQLTFEQLGAAPDAARIAKLREVAAGNGALLTARELEVLRLVANGDTNKGIAQALSLSEKTIDRHLSNIFDKLGVSSRTAAAAFAYRHKLV